MTVAPGTLADFAEFTTVSPATIEFTPVAAAKTIVIGSVINGSNAQQITSVTVEGVAASLIDHAEDTAGEGGRVDLWVLHGTFAAGVALTIDLVHTGAASPKWASVWSLTAGATTETGVSGIREENQADPQIALDSGAVSSLRLAIIFSGHDARGSLVQVAGMVAEVTDVSNHDFGAQVAKFGIQSTAATGSFTIGYTATTEDVAMVAVAIQEVAGGTLFTISPTGSITGAGALTRLSAKVIAGSITGSGVLALVKVIVLALAGSITATGTLVKSAAKNLVGSITGSGALTKSTSIQLAGSISSAGIVVKAIAKNLVGSVTPSGALANVVSAAAALFRRLEGALGHNRQDGGIT